MIVKPQFVDVKWHPRNKSHYHSKGYIFTKMGDIFAVDVDDLADGCTSSITVLCDYCMSNGTRTEVIKTYNTYIQQNKKGIINKDCCNKCKPLKIKESNMVKYGVESTNSLKEVREKQVDTLIKKYGVDNPAKSQEFQSKIVSTNLERYGTKTPAQNSEIKSKIKNTNIERYGYISPTLNDDVRQKQIISMMNNHGVKYPMESESIKNKAHESLYKNNTAPTSRQQKYIHNIICGELNYPFKNYFLDIAFPEEMIYVECDFGGHWLQVKFGNMTQEEFDNAERKRWYSLYRGGWKSIKIISKKDKVPQEDVLLNMMQYAREYLSGNHSWINFNIDNGDIEMSSNNILYDYGSLMNVYKKG